MTITTERAREILKRAGRRAEQDEHERERSASAMEAATVRVEALHRYTGVRRFLYENALTVVAFVFFVGSMTGLVFVGQRAYNNDRQEHGEPSVGVVTYLRSGHFVEATGENWESAFLQMAVFVLLTRMLYQRGSSESKRIGEPEEV